jgi:hypothetical protein
LSFHNHILTHQNKAINKTWAYTKLYSKHFKTIIMTFKVINDFRWCTTNFVNNNLKRQKKKEGVCSLSFTSSSKFEGLPSNEKVDSFSDSLLFSSWFLVSFLSQIDLDSSHFVLKHNIWYLSFFSILSILLLFFCIFLFFFS